MLRRLYGVLITIVGLWVAFQYFLARNDKPFKVAAFFLGLFLVLFMLYRWSKIYQTCQVLKIYCGDGRPRLDWIRIRREGWTWILPMWMPYGVSVSRFMNHIEPIEQALSCSLRVDHYNKRFWVKVGTRPLPTHVDYDSGPKKPKDRPAGGVWVWFGTSQWGTLIRDLTKLPHLIIGGTTRSGKSVFLRSVLTQIMQFYSPKQVRIWLADLKGELEFNAFAGMPHVQGGIRRSFDMYRELVDEIELEVKRRYELISRSGFEDIESYNASLPPESPDWLPYLFLVIDEFARLQVDIGPTRGERDDRQNILTRTSEFAAVGAAIGLHLIIATQRPDAKVFPGDIKANFPAVVAFRVKNVTNSQILLDNGLAAVLPLQVKGRGIFQLDDETTFQGPWLPKQGARILLDSQRSPNAERPVIQVAEELEPEAELAPQWAR